MVKRAVLGMLLAFATPVVASSFKVQDSQQNITITSQQIEYKTAENLCEIMGNAKAVWDTGQVITAHSFLVFLNDKNEIQKIDALPGGSEKVVYQKDDLTMHAEKCIYLTVPEEKIHCFDHVHLVQKNGNTLDGDEGIVTIKTGHYKVISKTKRPVQAKVIPEKKTKEKVDHRA
jgi:lipopolysaccharide export system protein LptA